MRWQTLQEVFGNAVELAREQRAGYLDEACGNDSELRALVESLLASSDGSLLTQSVAAAMSAELGPGSRVGPYEIEQQVGQGGMGAVYRARRVDGQFEQVVALKTLRTAFPHPSLEARFRRERQILARLTHPHIARLLDGGLTPEGFPYLAMEYVEGVPLLQYAKGRSEDDKLALFAQVLAAAQYLHQNLVVHRDIKPGNILVTATGEAKLLDFGIAKVLDPGMAEEGLTLALERVLTPEYCSPEQASGAELNTLSDVYSLGVVLYELMAGRRPYTVDRASTEAMLRSILDARPEPLAGDLGRVAAKALHPDPAERYASAAELAADLERYQQHYPVQAAPPSRWRAISKFIRRHRVGVAATAAAVTALTLALGVAVRAERRASARFAQVRTVASSLVFDVDKAVRDLPGSLQARQLLVSRASQYLDSLYADAAETPGLAAEVADAYEQLCDIQHARSVTSLFDPAGAARSAEREIALRRPLALAGDVRQAHRTADAYDRWARARLETTANPERDVLPKLREARAFVAGERQRHPSDQNLRQSDLALLTTEGTAKRQANQPLPARADLELALRGYAELAAAHPGEARWQKALARLHNDIGATYTGDATTDGNKEDGLRHYREAEKIVRGLLARVPPEADALDLGQTLQRVGFALNNLKRPGEALAPARESLQLYRELAAGDPKDNAGRARVRTQWGNVVLFLQNAGHLAEAEREARAALAEIERQPGMTEWRSQRDLADLLGYSGDINLRLARPAAAAPMLRRGVGIYETLVRQNPKNDVFLGRLARMRALLAEALHAVDPGEGRAMQEKSFAEFRVYEQTGPLQALSQKRVRRLEEIYGVKYTAASARPVQ